MKEFELYLCTGQKLAKGRPLTKVVRAAIRGGVDVVQLREKEMSAKELITVGKELRKITADAGVTFIVNDRLDIALAVDADGVHMGQDDIPAQEARKLLGPDKILGISTHRLPEALQAMADGADYMGVGPVFPTQAKNYNVGLDYVRQVAAHATIPWVAIGGIFAHNLAELIKAGADRVAVISAIVAPDDIEASTRRLKEALRRAKQEREEAKA